MPMVMAVMRRRMFRSNVGLTRCLSTGIRGIAPPKFCHVECSRLVGGHWIEESKIVKY